MTEATQFTLYLACYKPTTECRDPDAHRCVADLSVTPLTFPLLVCTTNSSLMYAVADAMSSTTRNSQWLSGDAGDGGRRPKGRPEGRPGGRRLGQQAAGAAAAGDGGVENNRAATDDGLSEAG